MTALFRLSARPTRLLAGLALPLCLLAPAWADPPDNLPAARPGDPGAAGSVRKAAGKGYSSPVVIPAAAFISDGSDADGFMFYFGGGFVAADVGYVCLYAPVYLPQGSTITSLYANVVDNDSSEDLEVDLRRLDHLSGATEIIAAVVSSGQTPYIQLIVTPVTTYPVVSSDSSYYLTTCLVQDTLILYAVRVSYVD
jgi:hypothetical protein